MMEFSDGFVSNDQHEHARSISENADTLPTNALHISIPSSNNKSPRPTMSPMSPRSCTVSITSPTEGSPSKRSPGKRSPGKYERHSLSPKNGQPKKGKTLLL